jgi:hypothetical protein
MPGIDHCAAGEVRQLHKVIVPQIAFRRDKTHAPVTILSPESHGRARQRGHDHQYTEQWQIDALPPESRSPSGRNMMRLRLFPLAELPE